MRDGVTQIRDESRIADQKTLSFLYQGNDIVLDEPFERFFYELECIKGTWSVRELHRQNDTKLYIRAGISKKAGAFAGKARIIRNQYSFIGKECLCPGIP